MDLKQLKKDAEIGISLIKNTSNLEKWRIKYLGRKSALSLFFNSLSKLSLKEKKEKGQKANAIRQLFSSLYKKKKNDLDSNSSFSSDFTQSVSHISLAGCPAGIFKASKL